MLGFNPPFLVDNTISVSGNNQTRPAIFVCRRVPRRLLDPNKLSPQSGDGARSQSSNAVYPTVELRYPAQILKDLLFEVAYVGNKGTKLAGFRNINQRAVVFSPTGVATAGERPYPQLGDIQFLENRVLSNYHSMQVRVEKRFSRGLSFLSSYTWGKALTESPDHLSTGAPARVWMSDVPEPQNLIPQG